LHVFPLPFAAQQFAPTQDSPSPAAATSEISLRSLQMSEDDRRAPFLRSCLECLKTRPPLRRWRPFVGCVSMWYTTPIASSFVMITHTVALSPHPLAIFWGDPLPFFSEHFVLYAFFTSDESPSPSATRSNLLLLRDHPLLCIVL